MRDIFGATWDVTVLAVDWTAGASVAGSSISLKRGAQLSESSSKARLSANSGLVLFELAMNGDSKVDVPGVVSSVKAPEGGAEAESTIMSLGDTVWTDDDVASGKLLLS